MQQACRLGKNVRGSEASAGQASLREERAQHPLYVSAVSSTHNIHTQLADSSTHGIGTCGALELEPKVTP